MDKKFKVEKSLYLNTKRHLAQYSPKYIFWPPKNSQYIPPAFFEETPDPLPNSSVSGYPISCEFNKYYFDNKDLVIDSFKLFEEDGTEVTNTLLMNYLNDPNKKHNRYQFTLFPMDRLRWNHIYTVKIDYYEDEELKSFNWKFITRALAHRYYRVEKNNQLLKVKQNISYIIYLVPNNNNDIFKSWRYSKKRSSKAIIKYIDSNTLLVKVSGKIGNKFKFKFSNNKTITLQISNNDNSKYHTKKKIR